VISEIARAQAEGEPYDLVHDHGGSFWQRAREVRVPVLATLHLPKTFYWGRAFDCIAINTYFNCVSQTQLRSFADAPHMLGAIANGIPLRDFPLTPGPREDYLLWTGRICEEKGPHLAIEVARRAGLPLAIAGDIYRFSYHQDYFDREIRPHLDGQRVRHVSAPSFAAKIKLLANARAVLITSSVAETSSLVAMEAMACGTAVVALDCGALSEIVRNGVTGFVVQSIEEMVSALSRVSEIDPNACRARVEENFSATRMADDYERVYHRVVESAIRNGITAA
jgi:glycosyltransferase involved in cell wall biosynthesis